MSGWLIFLGIVFLLAILPVGASICYDESGAMGKLIVGPVKILLFPRPKKQKKDQQTKEKKKEKKEDPEGPPEGAPKNPRPREKEGGSLTDFLPLVDVALDMLSSLKAKLRVRYLRLRVILAGDDPCDLAINYGRAQAAGAAMLSQLDRFLVIKKQDVDIQCDFTADETKIIARVDLTITIGRIVALVAVYGVRALRTYRNIKKQGQGGAES